ncbi:hypothetical protein E3H11_17260 [Bradyrhizobium brasilense]|uniref:hypothetical protein n=1 Tax=Bradyrhizobium brasilense TaxID=1419277 RepID=UPI001456A319|nr:hypothetical protein [Bradyrhizobium brasilense]NLS70640.1 hypothetical protein [Bradyrhizobium brasilense]
MKSASSRVLDRSGAVSFELVLIFTGFLLIFIAISDVARFYVTANSVRTLSGELVRQTLIYCATQSQTATCTLPATGTNSVATAEAVVPFLGSSGFVSPPSASRTAMDTTTGVMNITASASYSFSFMLRMWPTTISQIAQNTQVGY